MYTCTYTHIDACIYARIRTAVTQRNTAHHITEPDQHEAQAGAAHRADGEGGKGQREKKHRVHALCLSACGGGGAATGGRPGPVLVCDTPQPPSPPGFER